MPSEWSLSGTGWNMGDFGGYPSDSEIEIECDECLEVTTADSMEGWNTETDTDTYETTVFCPECGDTE